MDTTTTGDVVLANSDEVHMVARSTDSPQSGKAHTTRTAKLTPEMALEILEAAILKCQEAGITSGISNAYKAGVVFAVVVLEGCEVNAGHIGLVVSANSGRQEY